MCVLELERSLPSADAEPPDAPGEIADAVTALRLATAGPIAVGPVLFERLDWRPFGVRPMLPIAAAPPPGEPIRLDVFRGGVAKLLRERLALAEDDRELGEALDRWELSLFQDAPVPRRNSCDRRSMRCSAPATDRGRRRSERRCCSGRTGASGRAASPACGACRTAWPTTRPPISCGVRSSRRSAAATGPSSSPSSTSRSSAFALGRRAVSPTRWQADSDLAHLRQRPAVTVEAVETERAILEGLERIDGLRREDAPAGGCSRQCARCSRTRRTGCARIRPSRRALSHAIDAFQRGAGGGRIALQNRLRDPLATKNARKFGRILFDFGILLHNGCVQDCTITGRTGDDVMGLTRLLSRPHTREQESVEESVEETPVQTDTPTLGQGHRVRQPEGRRREDDLDAEPRRGAQGEGVPRPLRRHGPAGQPDDEPGVEPGLDRALDVRRPRPPAADRERDREGGDRPGRVLDRPRRGGARPLEHDRPRARAREGAPPDEGPVRLRPHRHAALARPADDQRPRRGRPRDRPGAVRVPLAARARPAREHARR